MAAWGRRRRPPAHRHARQARRSTDIANVLVIEDEKDLRELLAGTIRSRLGHDVSTAADGREALKQLAGTDFDLVITDILMPNRAGLETIIDLRTTSPDTRIIAMSGGGRIRSSEFLEFAARLGADATLRKPFTLKAFVRAIEDCLPPPA